MAFVVTVKSETSAAQSSAEKLVTTLESAEKAGEQAGAAITRGARQGSSSLDAARQAAAGLGAELKGVAQTIGIAAGIHEVERLTNAYGELSNRLRSVAGDQQQLNSLMDETFKVAQDTRTEWNEVANAYQRIAKATEHLGTTQSDVMRLTKEISQGLSLSGASAQESRMAMMELTHAFELGTLTGREFRVLLKDATPIVGELAKALGMSRSEFIELGKHGKITAQMLMEGFDKAAPSIQAQFDKLTPTLEQSMTQLKNSAEKMFGAFAQATGVFEKFNAVLGDVGTAMSIVGDISKAVGDAATSVKDKTGIAGEVAGKAWDYVTHPIKAVKDVAGLAERGINALSDSIDANAIATSKMYRGYIAQIDALKKLDEQEAKLEQAERTLNAARAAGISVPQFSAAAAKAELERTAQMSRTFGVNFAPNFDEATKRAEELSEAVGKVKERLDGKRIKDDLEDMANQMAGFNKLVYDNDEHWQSIHRQLRDVDGALAQIESRRKLLLRPGEDPLVEMQGKGRQDAIDINRQEQDLLTKKATLTNEVTNSEYRWGASVAENKNAFLQHKLAIEATTSAIRDGKYTVEEAAFAWKKLGLEEDRATKILKELRQPLIDWSQTITAINVLLKQGKIDLQQYNDELEKLEKASPTRTGVLPRGAGRVGGRTIGGQEFAIGYERLSIEQEQRATARGTAPTLEQMGGERNYDLKAIEKIVVEQRELSKQTLDNTAWIDFASRQKLASDALNDAAIKTKAFKQELELLQLQAKQDGLTRGLDKIRTEVTDVAGALETTLVDAFHGVRDAIDQLVTSGEVSFQKLTQSILVDITNLLEAQAFKALLGMVGGGGGVPSVFGTGATQAFQGLFGSAPGYATGADFVVNGRPGIDSNLLMARVSNGERVQVTPAGQQASGGQAPRITVVNVTDASQWRHYMEQEGEGYYVNYQRRNESAVRGRTSGR